MFGPIEEWQAKPFSKSFLPGTYRILGGLTVLSLRKEKKCLIPDGFLNINLANDSSVQLA